jgi:hypothetical protein
LIAACGDGDDSAEAPKLDRPVEEGTVLADRFLKLITDRDVAGLRSFLADGFVLQRADGTHVLKNEYLTRLPELGAYTIADVVATQQDNVLVVRWMLSINQVIDGRAFSTAPAPRLSTFVWSDGSWHLIAHANFNTPTPEDASGPR